MNQTQKTLALMGALVLGGGALGLYAYYGVMKPDQRKSERQEADEKLFAQPAPAAPGSLASEATFETIVVTAKGDVTTVKKDGDQWKITSPLETKADKFTVESIVHQFRTAKVKRVIEEKPTEEDLKKYGFKPPQFNVKVTARVPGSSTPVELKYDGGIENPFDGSVYLMREGDSRVFSAEGGLRWTFEKSLFDLRDKEVFAFDEAKLKRVQVKGATNRYTLERADDKSWKLTEPKPLEADTAGIGTMLGALRGERATAFPPDSLEERKRLGFATPKLDVTLTLDGAEPLRLRLSKAADDKAYALREQGAQAVLAEVPLSALSHLDKAPAELRDKSVMKFKREEVAKISFKPAGGGAELIVQRAAGDAGTDEWEVLAPQKAPAQRLKISSALWTLENLKASSATQAPVQDAPKLGITAAARSVTLWDAGGKVLARMEVGKEVPTRTHLVYVRGSRQQIVEVESAKLGELPTQASDITATPAAAVPAPATSAPN